MNGLYKRLLSDYQITEGYLDIQAKPKGFSIEQHISILKMQKFIIEMDKKSSLLSEFFIEDWDYYKKFRRLYEIFLMKYFYNF